MPFQVDRLEIVIKRLQSQLLDLRFDGHCSGSDLAI